MAIERALQRSRPWQDAEALGIRRSDADKAPTHQTVSAPSSEGD
ncbi:hypothetical protein SJI00_04645 [Pseudomonas sp. RP23018S]|nr:hypothetical protein [Pseudomonas sp. RP23018S]MDZ5602069.1 hypothetical protein [Pseudomonas sp. RP23018S]